MATQYKNNGPKYITTSKYEAERTAGTLETGREYKITDWEAQEKLTAGVGINITSTTIKAIGVEYKNNETTQSSPLKFVKMTATQYASITPDSNTLYIIIG